MMDLVTPSPYHSTPHHTLTLSQHTLSHPHIWGQTLYVQLVMSRVHVLLVMCKCSCWLLWQLSLTLALMSPWCLRSSAATLVLPREATRWSRVLWFCGSTPLGSAPLVKSSSIT